MGLCDNLPSIDDFTTSFTQQQTFFSDLESVINALCAVASPIVLNQATEPSQIEFEAAYLAADVANTLPIPTTQEFHWYTGGEIRGIYRTINDLRANLWRRISLHGSGVFGAQDPSWSPVADRYVAQYGSSFLAVAGAGIYIFSVGDDDGDISLVIASSTAKSPVYNDAGTKVAYVKEAGGFDQIFTVNLNGTGDTQIGSVAAHRRLPHWRGSIIVFETLEYAGTTEIASITDAGGSLTRLTSNAFNDKHPQLSPDGTKIIFVSDRDGQDEIYIMDSDGTDQTRLTTTVGANANEYPTWSPDGAWVYWSKLIEVAAPGGVSTAHAVYKMLPDGSQQQLVISPETAVAEAEGANALSSWYWQTFTNGGFTPISYLFPSVDRHDGRLATSQIGSVGWGQLFCINDFESTGKVYRVSQWIDPGGNVRLLKKVDLDGTTATVQLPEAELPSDIEHLLIIIDGRGEATLNEGLAHLTFNGDVDSANYMTMRIAGASATPTRTEQAPGSAPGIAWAFPGLNTSPDSQGSYLLWVTNIRGTDNLKQAVIEGGTFISSAVANFRCQEAVGLWNNTDAIQSLQITLGSTLGDFLLGSVVSIYGFPAGVRWLE